MKNNKQKNTKDIHEKHPDSGYIYLIKNPASNEVALCAWETSLPIGEKVIFETRYGLDLGIVVGDASQLGKPYHCGNTSACGACVCADDVEDDDSDLVAEGEPTIIESEIHEDEKEVVLYRNYDNLDSGCKHCGKEKVEIKNNVTWLERIATDADLDRYADLSNREHDALTLCREKIKKHKLDMKLVTAHFLLVEPKIVFFFTSDVRVDFRELVKDLVSVFRIRIELRQIGVRDESRVLGGLAVCGRDYCCHGVTDKLQPVSIKMAKEQNLSLNSMKISGPCGRLLCCLAYEQDYYVEEKLKFPPEGSKLKIGRDLMRVSEVNVITRKLLLVSADGRILNIDATKTKYNSESKYWVVDKEYVKQLLED
jgi:cell fate regulator YaaT (PSP1 superfamily)